MAVDYNLAIIGGGPRALSALESLYCHLGQTKSNTPKTVLFESSGMPGSGWVYDPDQLPSNLLNISDRALKLEGRAACTIGDTQIPAFQGYQEWSGWKADSSGSAPDNFTTRANLGRYLQARFNSMAEPLIKAGYLALFPDMVTSIRPSDTFFRVNTSNSSAVIAREVLLTVGHQSTKSSEQIESWKEHARSKENLHMISNPYPISNYLDGINVDNDRTVAIRGFGLSMIDIVKAIVYKGGGKLEKGSSDYQYTAGPKVPKSIIPFSLDGLPLAPKPLNEKIDKQFNPGTSRLKKLESELNNLSTRSTGDYFEKFKTQMADLIADQYLELKAITVSHNLKKPDLVELILAYFKDEFQDHDLFYPIRIKSAEAMVKYLNMAKGGNNTSLEYVVGQVWRHAHHCLYESFAFSSLPSTTIHNIINLDERIKRFSYGPPVESIEQILALIDNGVLKPKVIADPDINLVENGWEFIEGGDVVVADIIINSVLDSPIISKVDTPLIVQLMDDGIVESYHEELGAKINSQFVAPWSQQPNRPTLSLIGRLAKGSVLGTDAILECFNPYFDDWAAGVTKRL